jgi:hypothetical protein
MATDPSSTAGTTVGAGEGGSVDDLTPGTPQATAAGGTEGDQAQLAEQLAAAQAEIDRLQRAHEQSLGEKNRLEQLDAEVQTLRRQIAGGGIVPPTTASDPRVQMAQQLNNDYLLTQDPNAPIEDRLAAQGRLAAANIAYTRQLEGQTQEQRQFNAELSQVPEADRREVELRAHRDGVMPNWAFQSLKSERWDKMQQQTEAERKRSEATETLRRQQGGKPNTSVTPVPAGAIADAGYTDDEYDNLVRQAGPPTYNPEARKRLADIDAGRVRPRAG